MAKKFFRIQYGHYSLSKMARHNSGDGGDGNRKGLCATDSIQALLSNTAYTTRDGWEVVVMEGEKVTDIYDGCRIRPTKIVAQMSAKEFAAKVADGSAYDWES